MAARSVQEVAQELTSSGEPSPAFGSTLKGKTENLSGKVQKKVGQIEQVFEK